MIIAGRKPTNPTNYSSKNMLGGNKVAFTSAPAQQVSLYTVKNSTAIKKALPAVAFASSILGSAFYLIGATGLYYDRYKEKQAQKNTPMIKLAPTSLSNYQYFYAPSEIMKSSKLDKKNKDGEGVKTIEASTKFGKMGITSAKLAITATAAAGIACGLGEGIPLMALGEATNLGSAGIIETPIGTGLFGIGIASIFAGLALENTPELKLNDLDLMAEKTLAKKSKLILKNIKDTGKEISLSIFEIGKNIFNPKFFKENILQSTPRTVVFSEAINKEGKVIFSKMLRHNKNYLMHASSFTLAVGGAGLIVSSLLNQNKAQKVGLVVEEGGFLFDNLGMTRYGLDKLTTGGKPAGASFAIGGVINAISQFIGLDNKDGRALQWLGISGVFLGFAIDRGKHLKSALKSAKQRPELTRTVREWKLNLTEMIKNKGELKKLLEELKKNKPVTNEKFLNLEKTFANAIGENYKPTDAIQKELEKHLEKEVATKVTHLDTADYEKSKEVLKICTKKIFGSENPTPV